MTSTSGPSSTDPEQPAAGVAELRLEQLHRSDWGRLVALLVARTRRLDLAEDAVAEAFAAAAGRWPSNGVPALPAAWLYTAAYRHVVGRLRTEAVAGRKVPLLVVRPHSDPHGAHEVGDEAGLPDDRLDLILLCCHPALTPESRSALALRLVIGTTTEQIARLFLVPTPTMAARITRAKKKIVVAGLPLGAPVADELGVRIDEVCRTIYLAFTAGYTPGDGPDLLRVDLAGDAVRLAEVVHEVAPDAAPPSALLALLLLQHARRDAREEDGRLVTLAEQDRSRWHDDEIDRGRSLLGGLEPATGYAEELRLQALIAAEHARARRADDTDWPVIAGHYSALESATGSAVVRLNRAVAVAEADGPVPGLALLEGLDELLPHHHRLPAVRAELARRAGDHEAAQVAYRRAIERCGNEAERAHLEDRLRTLGV